ncbi:hypothetical protein PR048_028391 [Dryococelus australis]|uniref:Uncharacterized protein n=1 Tax=Dryococelus australis TaxID=614101 RepID=A0ABQ9GEA6_9NEOP|nr:hypothetical protein PR048_028391 [Dryococelus australis]
MPTADDLVAYATIECALQKKRNLNARYRHKMVPKKESLYTRQLAYGTGVLPRRLDKLPEQGRTNLPGTFKNGYSFRRKYIYISMSKAITPNERLMATLRCLATGKTLEDLKVSCHIAAQTDQQRRRNENLNIAVTLRIASEPWMGSL